MLMLIMLMMMTTTTTTATMMIMLLMLMMEAGFPFLAFSSQVQKESSCTLSRLFRTLSRLIVTGHTFFHGKTHHRHKISDFNVYWAKPTTIWFTYPKW